VVRVLIVTPTIGSPELVNALISVRAQAFRELEGVEVMHVLMVDGKDFESKVIDALIVAEDELEEPGFNLKTEVVTWPYNTGGKGFYGHKLYAAAAMLVTPDIDWVLFLDQDNWYEPNHIESLVTTGQSMSLDYAYALRKFYTWDGKYFDDDNCSSLGKWKIWDNGGHHLIDTGCYCFRGEYISRMGHLWNMGWGADINFVERTMATARYETTGLRTFCYRMGSPTNPKTEEEREFIVSRNAYSLEKYKGNYPWELEN
jgi:hypothetical protein